MTKEEIIKFMNENLTCYLATAENNQPRVRAMMAYRADEKGIIFSTGNTKDLYRQIKNNPLVEVCFFNAQSNTQVRVKGKAVIKEDIELKKEIVNNRPFLKPVVEKMGYDILIVFGVVDCVANVWTFETNLSPKEYINLS
ncbi:MAG: pyridoxamine 5'-phosphate oxidase [Candidatus Omnitrophica bacterium CG11_big_fil_rev_8_21_14_0_20_42_13]|uniref:Pyridoxamine 5'-phosphate oxidase n=1 Tax=Candidatus Ghiorseimicrobium undicola TaxID=1974746 RepID=A0A2H0LZH6_9BACT|nr:MAG: pyridoxamine 5'-phosphate oxidase [Candidatus Omnitrophica bacterium CG11_big_fil_rev_8_21_14_0_20_42_13]